MKVLQKILTLVAMVGYIGITTAQSAALAHVNIHVAVAYPKAKGTYDVVVKDTPGTKLVLYVNDKNPVKATVNKQDWATFRKVKMADKGKLSFTRVLKGSHGPYQKPINYTQQFVVTNGKVDFVSSKPPTETSKAVEATPAPTPAATQNTTDNQLSNNNYYTNTDGNEVHSPATSTNGSVPAGATAKCRDGSYSFSQHHSGTCSYHGGVASWL